jgi:carbon-monoxide dehydrogenase medium subunit
MDIAVVGVALRLELQGGKCKHARIVLGAVAPVPLRVRDAEAALIGHPFSESRTERAATLAAKACAPIDDVRGSAWYRQRMVAVLTKRGLNRLRP